MVNNDPTYQMWLRIDAACDRFEAAWRAGERPDLGAYSADRSSVERGPLLLALIAVDAEYRRQAGDHFTLSEYRQRFPELDQRDLERVLAPHISTGPAATLSESSVASAAEFPEVPGYQVIGEIARGGMGCVLAARDLHLDREVAIKVLRPEMTAAEACRRFVRESIITGRLSHPGIPPVYALGTLTDGQPFLAMKLVRGQTLAEILASTTPTRYDLMRVFEQVAEAVGFAHSVGVVHRDLKPQNVMVGEFGEVQVMDWGLAKAEVRGDPTGANDDANLTLTWLGSADSSVDHPGSARRPSAADETRPGSIFGTIPYMPPEQARGELDRIGPHSDVFSLGGILCTMLTGKPPYADRPVRALLTMAEHADLNEAFSRLDRSGADADLIALAKRCLQRAPEERPANGQTVAEAVAAIRAGAEQRLRRAEQERAAAVVRAIEQRKKRRVQLALAAAIGVGVMTALIGAWRWQVRSERDQHDRELAAEQQRLELQRHDDEARFEKARLENEQRLALAVEEAKRREIEARATAVRATQERQTRTAIAAALEQAEVLRKQYRFTEAIKAVESAEHLAAGGLTDDLQRVVATAKRDLEFVIRLDGIRMRRSTWIPIPGSKTTTNVAYAPPAYKKAFHEWGLDPTADDATMAARRIAESPIRAELVAALDDWAVFEVDDSLRDAVLAVARRADPGPWLDRFRQAATHDDADRVEKLAAEADLAALTPAMLVSLTDVMKMRDLDPTPILMAASIRHPDDFLIAFNLGLWHMIRKSPDAIGYYRAARALRPENALVVLQLGIALRESGDADAAIMAFREALRLEDRDPVTHTFLAIALKEQGDLKGAIAELRRAAELEPENAIVLMVLGTTLHESGDVKGARAIYEKVVELTPNDPRPWAALAIARNQFGDSDGAFEAFRKAVKCGTKDPSVFAMYGALLKERGDTPGAIRAYRQAITLDPEDPKTHALLGIALMDNDDPDGAIEAYRASLELNPKEARVHALLGLALRERGDLDDALHHCSEAQRLGYKEPMFKFITQQIEDQRDERNTAIRRVLGVIVPVP